MITMTVREKWHSKKRIIKGMTNQGWIVLFVGNEKECWHYMNMRRKYYKTIDKHNKGVI